LGYGGQGRLDERDRAQFFHVQRARVVGPAVAGILVARLARLVLFANAVSYIAVIIGLLLMKFIASTALMASRWSTS